MSTSSAEWRHGVDPLAPRRAEAPSFWMCRCGLIASQGERHYDCRCDGSPMSASPHPAPRARPADLQAFLDLPAPTAPRGGIRFETERSAADMPANQAELDRLMAELRTGHLAEVDRRAELLRPLVEAGLRIELSPVSLRCEGGAGGTYRIVAEQTFRLLLPDPEDHS